MFLKKATAHVTPTSRREANACQVKKEATTPKLLFKGPLRPARNPLIQPMSTSAVAKPGADALRHRKSAVDDATLDPPSLGRDADSREKPDSGSSPAHSGSPSACHSWKTAELLLAPLLFTALSFFVRMYRIGANNGVVWDEAHFGKFGSYYLRHEFYHDVHPPLGKMLVGLSGYLAGYNGSWDFPSGETYPDYIDYTKMRLFQAVFSALCVPMAYYTGKDLGFSIPSTWLFTLMVCLELLYVTLGRFILLDSMLLFFTVGTFLALARFNSLNTREKHFSRKWCKWLVLTGVFLGCTCLVKMVGLFVTTLVGLYVVADLWTLLGDKTVSWTVYGMHWLARIVGLVMVPLLIFLMSFKIHFDLLYKSGPGDATMLSLFQANLLGSGVEGLPRDVTMRHSRVTFKNQGLSGGLLHSHVQTYPEGSKQQQVTTYSHKDSNNEWVFERARPLDHYYQHDEFNQEIEYIYDGMAVRIIHPNTGRNLHTHDVPAPVTSSMLEVSGYGNVTIGDPKDNWVVEIMDQQDKSEDHRKLHPLTSSFRLRLPELGCYLAVSGAHLPAWGWRQGEVVCQKDPFKKDKRTWWNLEENVNNLLPKPDEGFKLPKTTFLRDFVQLNLAMMATNNALVPESDKQDNLASQWWEWPTLYSGIRMCGWNPEKVKYFMIGSPATTWTSTAGVVVFALLTVYYLVRWQRQYVDFPAGDAAKGQLFKMAGVYPMFGWGLHYLPFVIMGRVTYVHHYLPALYFAMIVFCYEIESLTRQWRRPTAGLAKKAGYWLVYATLYATVAGAFYYWRHMSFGIEGDSSKYKYLDLLPSWLIG